MDTEFGDYYDNDEALRFACRQIRLSRVHERSKVLPALRDLIERTAETKSTRYLLTSVNFYEKNAMEYVDSKCCKRRSRLVL